MSEPNNSRESALRKAQDRKALENEAEARERRIKRRREGDVKSRALTRQKSRQRAFKYAGLWVGAILIGLFIVIWFSKDLVDWLHGLAG